MPLNFLSETESPTLRELQAVPGCVLLEFGTEWCPHCRAAAQPVQAALALLPQWRHLPIEDGPGRKLGRHFKVKFWPTLVAMRGGQELGRLVRPTQTDEVSRWLASLLA
jgi:thioredoxin 1